LYIEAGSHAGAGLLLYPRQTISEKGRAPHETRPFSVAKYAGEPKLDPPKNYLLTKRPNLGAGRTRQIAMDGLNRVVQDLQDVGRVVGERTGILL